MHRHFWQKFHRCKSQVLSTSLQGGTTMKEICSQDCEKTIVFTRKAQITSEVYHKIR